MPIRKNDSGKRWVEMELLVPGTPEQVWEAIATGAGNAGWFVKGEIEPQVGGTLRLHFGPDMTSTGEVTVWDPPYTFGYVEREWMPGAPAVATEITITSRSGDRCVVRMVHSLFTSAEDWDDQLEGFEQGWPGFFAVLRLYLKHFAGASAASFMAMMPASEQLLTAWRRLGDATGVTGMNVGERCTATSAPEPLSGVVEQVHQDDIGRYLLVRVDSPAPGAFLIGCGDAAKSIGTPGTLVSVNRYFYGDNAAELAAENEPRWREWLANTFEAAQQQEGAATG